MNKLLVICGQTATGKTSLALKLADKLKGELISADSRQVYKDMDIGTGKDLPVNAKFKYQNAKLGGYYKVGNVKIWGYDLVKTTKEFNVSDYAKIAREIINDIWNRKKLPIIVGGSGLYIKGLMDGIDTLGIGKNERLRKKLSEKTIDELLSVLMTLNCVKASSLNESDRKNSRRLIRAIEIAKSKSLSSSSNTSLAKELEADILFVGLKIQRDELLKRIEKRVKERVEEGFLEEIRLLLRKGVKWNDSAMTATGYRQLESYINKSKSLDEVIKDWTRSEFRYAKRQLTWFKKDGRVNWFDVTDKKSPERIEKFVKKWYFKE